MAFVPYVPLTVTRGVATTFTVGRSGQPTFTTYGHPGTTTTTALLAEDGTPILLETGDLILTA